MRLTNVTKNRTIVEGLEVADSFWQRTKGLLGRSRILDDQALWIKKCNSIHTFAMKFPIDCVFVCAHLRVQKTYENIQPWRVVWPVWRAQSVIEMKAGSIRRNQIEMGDQMHVGN